MFSSRLPNLALADHCRSLRYLIESGLTLPKAMKQQATKGPLSIRPVAKRLAAVLAEGEDLPTALQDVAHYFPPIFLSLIAVAEETGQLPIALEELEEYFRLQDRLWKNFISQITWPVIQFIGAVLVIAFLIYILGILPANPISVFGLKGETGAMIFLGSVGGVVLFIFLGYWFMSHVAKKGGVIDKFLLGLPYLGGCLEALALSRFSLCMGILVDAGARIGDSLKLSLEATSNHAFAERATQAKAHIESGLTLEEALREMHLFPEEYIDIVGTAEIAAQEGKVFHQQAKYYNDTATLRMKVLATVAAKLVWLLVAVFIIALIFNLALQYIGTINNALQGL